MIALLESPTNQVQGFLAAGHVCAVMGWTEYEPIAARYRVPIVVTGFEPLDLLEGILMTIQQLEDGRAEVENQYVRAVKRDGNALARETVLEVFEVGERSWRGIGPIPDSGYRLRPAYARFDAERLFDVGESAPASIPRASREPSSRARRRPSTAPPTGSCAHPRNRSGHRWCHRRVPAPHSSRPVGDRTPARPLVQVAPIGSAAATAGAVAGGARGGTS